MGATPEVANSCGADDAGATEPPCNPPGTPPPNFMARALASVSADMAESDLIRLSVLAQIVGLEIARAGKAVSLPQAGLLLVRALLGDDEHAGQPPAMLKVYRIFAYRPEALSDVATDLDGCHYPAERTRQLQVLVVPLLQGFGIDAGTPGASLAVVRDDAFQAFGLKARTATAQTVGPSIDPRAVQPQGGAWNPSNPRKCWTGAEIRAVDQMHANGMTNAEVAKVVGKSRAAVGAKFGSDQSRKSDNLRRFLSGRLDPAEHLADLAARC